MTGERVKAISVVVVTFNEENNISECLDALTRQDYLKDRYEIVIVDAGTDRTAEIAARYPGVRVIHSEKGFSLQKNAGWRAARHDIIAFTDADCRVPNGWLRAIGETFADNSVQAAGGDAFITADVGRLGRCIGAVGHPAGGSLGLAVNVKQDDRGISFVAGCNSVFSREALVQMNGFHPDFEEGGEDVDLSRRLRQAGHVIHYVPGMFLYHKPHELMGRYCRWNIGVGVTRWSLHRPGFARIVAYPWFPVWPGGLILAWLALTVVLPQFGLLVAIAGWLIWLAILRLFSRPYQELCKRRKQIGVSRMDTLTIVPFLVIVRQVCMSIGEWIKWKRAR